MATTLPSTLNVPVPGRPMPLMLLKASVAKPSPSYLKSYCSVCLPGENVRAFPANPLQVKQVPEEHRLALQQVEAVAAESTAVGDDHALGATLRHGDVRCDRVRRVEQAGASPGGCR